MIDPSNADKGRRVLYVGALPGFASREAKIVQYNGGPSVFVIFDGEKVPVPIYCGDLFWIK